MKKPNIKTKPKAKPAAPAETVGRRYSYTAYGMYSRRVNEPDAKWYGRSNYKTEDEARDNLRQVGGRYMNVGGITVDLGPSENLYEYKLVKLQIDAEVLHVETRKI